MSGRAREYRGWASLTLALLLGIGVWTGGGSHVGYAGEPSTGRSAETGTPPQVHVTAPRGVVQRPTSTEAMNARIEVAAHELRNYPPIPRLAFTDFTYPANESEYGALHGWGLLLVTALSQDGSELPLAGVHLQTATLGQELRLAHSRRPPAYPDDSEIAKVLGRHRYDGVYLFPVHAAFSQGTIAIDFARNREGFVAARFPEVTQGLTLPYPVAEPTDHQPDPEALRRLLVPFVQEMAREAERMDPRERIFELFNAYEAFTSEHQPLIERFVGWGLESPALRTALGPALITLHETFNRELAEAIEAVVGDRERALVLSSGFLSLMDGNLLLDFVYGDARARARRWEGLRVLAQQALGSDPAE